VQAESPRNLFSVGIKAAIEGSVSLHTDMENGTLNNVKESFNPSMIDKGDPQEMGVIQRNHLCIIQRKVHEGE
jgi:hypothetical protein